MNWSKRYHSNLIYGRNQTRRYSVYAQVYKSLCIKLNDDPDKYTDTLWICGKEKNITDDIALSDNAELSGWNWVAYYPDYTAGAPYAFSSLVSEDSLHSDLYLAKGYDGSFYSVDYEFSNLYTYPGEGYMLQLDYGRWYEDEDTLNRNAILNYPADEPQGVAPGQRYGGSKQLAETAHFRFRSRTGDFLPVLVKEVSVNNRIPGEGDEIGIFSADTLCIGAGLWENGLIGFAAWKDDESTPELDGFRSYNSLTFRYWDASENEEIGQINISLSYSRPFRILHDA